MLKNVLDFFFNKVDEVLTNFFIKGQIVNVLDFVGCVAYSSTFLSFFFFFNQRFKSVKTIFTLKAVSSLQAIVGGY